VAALQMSCPANGRLCRLQVANFLASGLDFSNVSNVVGGIDAYATVDPSTPRY
jgi:hypothetical protein